MLRLTEIKLPLDHSESALADCILDRLAIEADQLVRYAIYRRGVDARRRSAIAFIYTLDVEVADEPALFKRLANRRHITHTPDMDYRLVATAPPGLTQRPVVIGTGPCGLFAGLVLAQMGFRPLILERGKAVREHTRDTFGLWRKSILNPESNVQFGEGGAGTLARSRTRAFLAARFSPNSSRPAPPPKSSTSANLTSAPSASSAWSNACASRFTPPAEKSVFRAR